MLTLTVRKIYGPTTVSGCRKSRGKFFLDVIRKLVERLKNEIALGKQVRTLSASLYLLLVYRSKKSSSPYPGGGSNFHSTGRETYRTEGHFSSIGIDIGRISLLCIS